jgi:hypothetical protein
LQVFGAKVKGFLIGVLLPCVDLKLQKKFPNDLMINDFPVGVVYPLVKILHWHWLT